MFGLLAVLLCYALLTFGAVLPYSWYLLSGLLLLAFTVYIVLQVFRTRKIEVVHLVLFALASLLLAFTTPKLAIGPLAGICAWSASRTNAKVIRFLHFLVFIGILESFLGL